MTIKLASRVHRVKPFLAMEVMEQARALESAGADIIYLCLGEPDFPTPEPVIRAATQALEAGATTYTHSLGLLELREEISAWYLRRYGVEVSPQRILVSSGTSPLLQMLFSALLEEGDEVLLGDPAYACYPNFIRYVGGVPVTVAGRAEDGFQMRPEAVREKMSPRTRALLINSPSNPAGSLIPPQWLQEYSRLPLALVSDEIYQGLTYEGAEHSLLEYTDQAFVLGGFSKTYAMTGWRLGYLIAPESCVRQLQILHQNFHICANHFVQKAGIAALRQCDAEVEQMRQQYDKRRHLMVEGLRAIGLGVARVPEGAFYVLADARHISGDSRRLCREILEATGVAVTPGIDFGEATEGFLRFSYANSLDKIEDALGRLKRYLRGRSVKPLTGQE